MFTPSTINFCLISNPTLKLFDIKMYQTKLNCEMEIKTELFEAENSKVQNNIKINETCKVTEYDEKIHDELTYDREVKNEICETNYFKPPAEYQDGEINKVLINAKNKMENNFIKQEINEEFIIKADNEQEYISGIRNVEKQEPFCNQNYILHHNNTELDCDVKIKTEIKVEDKVESEYIKYEINEEFIIKEDEEQEYFSGISNTAKQEPFSSENDLFNLNIPENSAVNESDSNQEVNLNTKNQNSGEKLYDCDSCKKVFTHSRSLRRHILTHGKKSHVCDVCQKAWHRKRDLQIHKRVHSDEKSFNCDVCQKKFRYRCNLTIHKRIHSDKKPYMCDVCKRSFNTSSHLKYHNLMHTGVNPHVCDVCQKTFSQISHLKRHIFVHTGEKPHACDICQKTFSVKDDLRIHKQVHSGEKPHTCDVCQKAFSRKAYLRRHKLNKCSDESVK